MASVLRRGSVFYARWKDSSGRQRRAATACGSKKDAQRFADDLERKAERQRRGLEPLEQAPAKMAFGELFDWWMAEYGLKLRGEFEGFLAQADGVQAGEILNPGHHSCAYRGAAAVAER